MLLIGSRFYTERSEQKKNSVIPYRERCLLFARPTFKGAIFECNPYLFLRLNDFRSYSHPSGPEYVFTTFVIRKLFLLKIYATFLCVHLHSPEKRKEFYENSETLRTKCFVSLWAELYEGEIFQIIVVRLLLLVLARALNSRSIALYKKMDKRVRQQIKTEKKRLHERG